MKAGDKFKFEGKEYFFVKASGRNNGTTHFFAQEVGCHNVSMRQIAYADMITAEAEEMNLNVRFVAFMRFTDCKEVRTTVRNAMFMRWISKAIEAFAAYNGGVHTAHNPYPIYNQDDFTQFILDNGSGWVDS